MMAMSTKKPSFSLCFLTLFLVAAKGPLASLAFCPSTTTTRHSHPVIASHESSAAALSRHNGRRPLTNCSPKQSLSRSPTKPNSSTTTQLQVWSHALAAIDGFYQTAPYAAGALTCCFKASAADYVAQTRQSSPMQKFQVARNVAFLLYGALYQGVAQEYIYNDCYADWFGDTNAPIVVIKKVLFDLLVQTPLVTLPMAYLTKAVIFRHSFQEGLLRYKHDVVNHGLLTKYFKLWGPVQCLTFGVVPEHLRITFIATVSFFWLIIFSTVSGRAQPVTNTAKSPLVVKKKDNQKLVEIVDTASAASLMNNSTAFAATTSIRATNDTIS